MLQVPSHTFRIAHRYAQDRVSRHPSDKLQRTSGVCIARSCISVTHMCRVQCNTPPPPPNHSLIPLIRPHFRPSWVRLRPFWYHLPLTRRSFTLLGGPTYARVHTYTSIHAPSREKVLRVTAERGGMIKGKRKRLRRRRYGEEVAELIPESYVQREEDGERRGVVSKSVGAGEAT